MPWKDGAGEVGVAVEIERFPGEQLRDIGVAAGPEQIVAAPAVRVFAVLDRLAGDGQHRAQVGEDGPEAVAVGQVRTFQLLGAGGPEALPWVVQVPRVEIDDLRSFDGDDAAYLPRLHRPGVAGADGDGMTMSQGTAICFFGDAFVEGVVDSDGRRFGGKISPRATNHGGSSPFLLLRLFRYAPCGLG
jgi:hypothetical protein